MKVKNNKVEFECESLSQSVGFYFLFFVAGILFSFVALAPIGFVVAFILGSVALLTLLGMLYADAPKTGLTTALAFVLPTICVSVYLFISKLFYN